MRIVWNFLCCMMKDFLIEYSKLKRRKIQIHYNKTCVHLQLSSIVSLPLETILDSSVEIGIESILSSVLLNIYLRNRVLCSFTHWQNSLTVKFKFNCHQGNLLIECSLCGGLRDITEPTILSRSLSTLCKILSLSLLYTLLFQHDQRNSTMNQLSVKYSLEDEQIIPFKIQFHK